MAKDINKRLLEAFDEPPLLGLGFTDTPGLGEQEKKFLLLLHQTQDLPEFLKFVNETVINYSEAIAPSRTKRARTSRPEPKFTPEPFRRQPSRNQRQPETETQQPKKKIKLEKSSHSSEGLESHEEPKKKEEVQPDFIPQSQRKSTISAPTVSNEFRDPIRLLTHHESPLVDIDLKEIVSTKSFSLLTSVEKNNLLEYLVSHDKASLYYLNTMFRNPFLFKDLKRYQELLKSSFFEEHATQIYNNETPIGNLFFRTPSVRPELEEEPKGIDLFAPSKSTSVPLIKTETSPNKFQSFHFMEGDDSDQDTSFVEDLKSYGYPQQQT